jgi:subtilisin family serine protease
VVGQQNARIVASTATSLQIALDQPLSAGDYSISLMNQDGGQFERTAGISVVANDTSDTVVGGSFAAIKPGISEAQLKGAVEPAGFVLERFRPAIIPTSIGVCGQSSVQFKDTQTRPSSESLNALRNALRSLGEDTVWDLNAKVDFDHPGLFSREIKQVKLQTAIVQQITSNLNIAVLDSGVSSHPEFNINGSGNILDLQNARNFTTEKNPTDARTLDLDVSDLAIEKSADGNVVSQQRTGHGTAVAAIIAAPAGNYDGFFGQMIGVAPGATITPIKVCTKDAKCDTADVTVGICHAISLKNTPKPVQVLNLSIAGKKPSHMVYQALKEANSAGISVVVSSGNDGKDTSKPTQYPAYYAVDLPGKHQAIPGLIAVGSFGSTKVSDFSSRGPWVTLVAPGEDILSTSVTNTDVGYRLFSGTSFAAPQIAGLVALLRDRNPDLSPENIKKSIINLVKPIAGCAKDECGTGLLDVNQVSMTKK